MLSSGRVGPAGGLLAEGALAGAGLGGDPAAGLAAGLAAVGHGAADGPAGGAGIGGRVLVVVFEGLVVVAAPHGLFEVTVVGVALADVGAGQAADGRAAAGRPGRVDVIVVV